MRTILSYALRISFAVALLLSAAFLSLPLVAPPQHQVDLPTFPLELRVIDVPQWKGGCLSITFEEINRSSDPLWLTEMGPYFNLALDVSRDETSPQQLEWVNISGISDIRTHEVQLLSPSAVVRRVACLPPTFWIANWNIETHREISVRGLLQIQIFFLQSADEAKRFREFATGPAESIASNATLTVGIPCRLDDPCRADCAKPPRGITGENRMVPDIASYDEGGLKLSAQLARKGTDCPDPPPQKP
jgi:hypothetical protein